MRPEISNKKARRVFEASGLSKAQVARRMGMTRTIADVPRLNRMLGIEPNPRNGRKQTKISYRNAKKLADAIGATYHEIGV